MYIQFLRPEYLYLLFAIPLLIFIHFYNLKSSRKQSFKFANFEAIARIKGIDIYSKGIGILILNLLILVLLTLYVSGITVYGEIQASDFSFILAIDSSQSMSADDFKPDRLTIAKNISASFIDSLPDRSKVGIISFSGNTFIEQELTTEKSALKTAIEEIKIREYGGTDIYEAVTISLRMLKGEQTKAVILLSDGQINVGNIYDVVELAKTDNAVIHTIGIGTTQGGKAKYGLSKIDEESLKGLSYGTGGEFFMVGNEEEMADAFKKIVPLTKKIGVIDISGYLGVAIVLLIIIQQTFSMRRAISI